MRHQSWVVKVDYNNGAGAGDILWRLGYQGDFQLVGGTDPTDWFYGQHEPSFTTPNTTGIFGLTLMDNGDFRIFPAGVTCGTGSAPPCLYSTIPVLQINEAAKTATIETHQIFPPICTISLAEIPSNSRMEILNTTFAACQGRQTRKSRNAQPEHPTDGLEYAGYRELLLSWISTAQPLSGGAMVS